MTAAARGLRRVLAALRRLPGVERLRYRMRPAMDATDVLSVLGALSAAGVRAWVAGGWAADALAGTHTRKHLDLDLVVSQAALTDAQAVLEREGFVLRDHQVVPAAGLPVSLVWSDARGWKVDVHPVNLTAPPFSARPDGTGSPALVTGKIAGCPVPCLSAELQLRFRHGYASGFEDRHDIALLREQVGRAIGRSRLLPAARRAPQGPGESALIVPLPEAESILSRLPRGGAEALPAHVTVLYPFAAPRAIDASTLAGIREVAGTVPGFAVTLADVARFPDVLYLPPEPAEPFSRLIAEAMARWPQHPPYEGRHPGEPIPHVTVHEGPEPPGAEHAVRRLLPIATRAEELWLVQRPPGGAWEVRERVALGAGA